MNKEDVKKRAQGRYGFIIIFAFIILTFLIGISIVFIIVSGTTQKESGMYKMRLKAEYASDSGKQVAISKLREFFMGRYLVPPHTQWLYYGEDINRDYEQDKAEELNNDNFFNINSLPVERAILPSLPYFSKSWLFDGKPYYVSGITEDSSIGTVAFRIKILDNSQRIYYKLPTIKLILENFKYIFPDKLLIISKIEKYIEEGMDYETVLKNLSNEYERSFFREFFTNHTFIKKVVKPSPILKNNQMVKSFKDVWQNKVFAQEERAPVNINNSRYEVLYSIFANISGLYISLDEKALSPFSKFLADLHYKKGNKFIDSFIERFGINPNVINMFFNNKKFGPPGNLYIGTVKEHKLKAEKALTIAREINSWRKMEFGLRMSVAFETYEALWDFLNQLVNSYPQEFSIHDIHLLWANLYPKSYINWFNQNYYVYREFSKIDLVDYTTEVMLGPGGYFDIESEGVVILKDKIEAKAFTSAIVKIFDIFIDEYQEDFEKGEIPKIIYEYSRRPLSGIIRKKIVPLKVYPFTGTYKKMQNIAGFVSLNIVDPENLNSEKSDLIEGYYISNTNTEKLTRLWTKKFKSCYIDLPKDNNVEIDEFYSKYDKFYKNKLFSGGVSFWIKPQFINYGYNKIYPSPLCGTVTFIAINRDNKTKQIWNEFGYIFLDDEDLFLLISTNPTYGTILLTDSVKKEAEDDFKLPPKVWTHISFIWGSEKEVNYDPEKKKYFYNTPEKYIKLFINGENVTQIITKRNKMPIIGSIIYEKNSNLNDFLGESNANYFSWIVEDAPFEYTISKIRTDIKDENDVLKEYVEGIYYNGQKVATFTSREFKLSKDYFFGSISWYGFSYSQRLENFNNYISVINMQLLGEDKKELFAGRITDPRGVGKFVIPLKNKFYYRAYFDINILDNVTTEPILNPPILDQVMIVLVPTYPEFIKPVQ